MDFARLILWLCFLAQLEHLVPDRASCGQGFENHLLRRYLQMLIENSVRYQFAYALDDRFEAIESDESSACALQVDCVIVGEITVPKDA